MHEGKEVCRSVQLGDNVNLSSLSILDQIRLILSSLSNKDEAELDMAEKLTSSKLRKIASLRDLLESAINQMDVKKENSVTLTVSSTFLPYIDKVIDIKTGLGQFYDIQVYKREFSQNIKHYFLVKISKRGGLYEKA